MSRQGSVHFVHRHKTSGGHHHFGVVEYKIARLAGCRLNMDPFDMNNKFSDKTSKEVQHFEQVCVGLSGAQNMEAAEAEQMHPSFSQGVLNKWVWTRTFVFFVNALIIIYHAIF